MMNATNNIPEETIEFINKRVTEEIAVMKEKVALDLKELKRDYIPRKNAAELKARILELHTDEKGQYFKNAYISVEELIKLIDKYLLDGDNEK